MARRRMVGPVMGLLAAVLVACGAVPTAGTAVPAGTGQTKAGQSTDTDTDDPADATTDTVDACALIGAADVTKLIGQNDGGKPVGFGSVDHRSTDCTWRNSTSQGLVLLSIGVPGTAPGGDFPPVPDNVAEYYSPLDAGFRQFGTDKVEFVAGDRLCAVRVSSNPIRPTTKKDRDAALVLAKDVRGRV